MVASNHPAPQQPNIEHFDIGACSDGLMIVSLSTAPTGRRTDHRGGGTMTTRTARALAQRILAIANVMDAPPSEGSGIVRIAAGDRFPPPPPPPPPPPQTHVRGDK